MAGEKAKGGKKNRKYGRNSVFCARYKAENRRVKNKRLKLQRHIKNYPNDVNAEQVLSVL